MPLTQKGLTIMSSMKKQYGDKKGEQVFYASRNKGRIEGVEKQTVTGRQRGDRRRLRENG